MLQRFIGAFAVLLILSGCVTHHAAKDYPDYLAEYESPSQLVATGLAAQYALTERARNYQSVYKPAQMGDKWLIEVGKMFRDTLEGPTVQRAFTALEHGGEQPLRLEFDINDYRFRTIRNVTSNVSFTMHVKAVRDGETVLSEVYSGEGDAPPGKMIFGAVGTRSAIQEATTVAFESALRKLSHDLAEL
ncbi:MAG: hypothetical protein ACQETD_02735 [Pseudomonadota bacterium]